MAKKQKLSVRAVLRRALTAETALETWHREACSLRDAHNEQAKIISAQANKIAEQWRTINELNRKVGDLTSCNDAFGELLKNNQEANEAASAQIETLKAELAWVKGQLSTALAHREALLDAMATVRFVMEEKAQGKL